MKNHLLVSLLLISIFGISNRAMAQEPDPAAFVVVEQEPQPLNIDSLKRMIGYPREAVEKNLEGKVILRVLVDEYGRYVRHLVLTNTNEIFGSRVNGHIHRIRFIPGIIEGKPAKVWVTIPFDFVLKKSEEGSGKKNRKKRRK
jgi:TonB family protein